MEKKPTPTLKQIAELTGFSQASISMILNKRPDVSFSEETVRAVTAAAERLGYAKASPPANKKPLSGKRVIAVFCPNITNPYYAMLVQAIEQSALERDFQVMTLNTYRSPDIEARALAAVVEAGAAGIIFAMPPQCPAALEKAALAISTVLISDKGSLLKIDTVEMDNYRAGILIARHLLELGHTRIAYVSTTLDPANSMRIRRLQGLEDTYKEACPGGRIAVRARAVTPAEELQDLFIEHRVGYSLAKECLSDGEITAFAAVNDMVAYGVIDAITEAGLRVPEDYSVCGFDNLFSSRLSPSSLTTVDNYIFEKGHNAFAMLCSRIGGAKGKGEAPEVITRVEYPPRLIVRGSTCRARGSRARARDASPKSPPIASPLD
ncbi:LacI family transcriptional regulator [bacterium]|nr:LacI family transcriptional regulator [bacterium]